MDLSLLYLPSAIAIGALHALEPGHAKTLTAAYLIGTKGTKRHAALLGISVAVTHSLVVIGLSVLAVLLGRETMTDEAGFYLAVGSSVLVVLLGSWLLFKRLRTLSRARAIHHGHEQHHDHGHHGQSHHHEHGHNHEHLSDDEHARRHAADLPAYVHAGERPTLLQVIMFGAAGGLVPCPAAVSVMLLSLSLSESGMGLIMVLGFSLGLAITLVGLGLLIVSGITRLSGHGRFARFSVLAPAFAAAMVIISGIVGLSTALLHHRI